MSAFRGTDFEIELPTEFADESTYAFAFPARGAFRPSVVVKTERLAAPTELSVYVDKQLDKIKQVLPHVAIVSRGPAKHGEWPAHTSIYEWGEPAQRVRQKQRYILLKDPNRVVTLTGTSSNEMFAETEPLFDAVFGSFKPTVASRSKA